MTKTILKNTEIAVKKDTKSEAKCANCGKKLFIITKNSAKKADIVVEIKCNRCKTINNIALN